MTPMLERVSGRSFIEQVPPLLVCLLQDAGKLPASPTLPKPDVFGYRVPGLAEMLDLKWVAKWDQRGRVDSMGFRDCDGLAAYRDTFDFHTASDVREFVYLAGSRRASIELIRWMRRDAQLAGRRLIGTFDAENEKLRRFLERSGCQCTRVVYEDL